MASRGFLERSDPRIMVSQQLSLFVCFGGFALISHYHSGRVNPPCLNDITAEMIFQQPSWAHKLSASDCFSSLISCDPSCSNVLSRWFVWGSMFSGFIALIPLIDMHTSIFHVTEATDLTVLDATATWVLLIISSIFFTIGSYAFVRAFKEPARPALFANYKHFSTDELLAAWLYLFATSPYIPFAMFYINVNRHKYVYWGALLASIFFVAGSAFFVYTCYPSHHHMLVRKFNMSIRLYCNAIFYMRRRKPIVALINDMCNIDVIYRCFLYWWSLIIHMKTNMHRKMRNRWYYRYLSGCLDRKALFSYTCRLIGLLPLGSSFMQQPFGEMKYLC